MKIAFTTPGESLDAPLDPRFGRAARFLIYDDEAKRIELLENAQNLDAAQGAGIQAARHLAEADVDRLITGDCGPKAFRVLREAGIAVHLCDQATIADAYDRFKAGELPETDAPNAESHWI